MSVGLGLLALGSAMFVVFDESVSMIVVAIAHAIRMAGLAFLVMPTTAYSMTGLDEVDVKHATGIVNAIRQVTGSLGSNLLIAMMAVVTLQYAPNDVAAAEGLSLSWVFMRASVFKRRFFAILIAVIVVFIGEKKRTIGKRLVFGMWRQIQIWQVIRVFATIRNDLNSHFVCLRLAEEGSVRLLCDCEENE